MKIPTLSEYAMAKKEMETFKKYDKVRLLPKFNNSILYVIAEVKDNIASLFPDDGGILVSADIKNLVKVIDKWK